MKKEFNKGFTLIELLVVISIIGFLSSVVLSSLNSIRDKARIAAGQAFATHNYRAVGDAGEGVYGFNEGIGAVANDASSSGHTMSLSSANLWSNDTPSGTGKSLAFNGTSDWAQTTNIAMNSNSETVSLWIKTTSTGMLAGQTYYRRLFINSWLFVDSASNYVYVNLNKVINDGKWHHVGYSLSGRNISVYVDGAKTNSGTLPADMALFNLSWQFGGGMCSGTCANYSAELIDDVHIYNRTLLSHEMRNIYTQGLNKVFARK